MKKLLFLLVFIACSIIGFSQSDTTFVIEGILKNEEFSKGYKNQKIYLFQNELKIDSTYSNWRGKYRFKKLKSGCYSLITASFNALIDNDKICFKNGGRRKIHHNYYALNPIYSYAKRTIDSSKTVKIKIQDKHEKELIDFEYKIISIENTQIPLVISKKMNSNKAEFLKIVWFNDYFETLKNLEKLYIEYPKENYEILFGKDEIPLLKAPIKMTLFQNTYYQICIKKDSYQPFEKTIKIKANQSNYEFVVVLEE
jgi:hypothetical protein